MTQTRLRCYDDSSLQTDVANCLRISEVFLVPQLEMLKRSWSTLSSASNPPGTDLQERVSLKVSCATFNQVPP